MLPLFVWPYHRALLLFCLAFPMLYSLKLFSVSCRFIHLQDGQFHAPQFPAKSGCHSLLVFLGIPLHSCFQHCQCCLRLPLSPHFSLEISLWAWFWIWWPSSTSPGVWCPHARFRGFRVKWGCPTLHFLPLRAVVLLLQLLLLSPTACLFGFFPPQWA